jgi:hypothetical protein
VIGTRLLVDRDGGGAVEEDARLEGDGSRLRAEGEIS